MPKHNLTEGRRAELCEWLTANGITPGDVPIDADMTIDKGPTGRFLRCEVFDRSPDGRLQADERCQKAAVVVVNVPLRHEPPDWWQPYLKPTRDQLLAVVEQVRRLHQPASVVAAAEAGVAPDCTVCGPNVWPCPTVRALDGEEQS
ncbi:hypothetical protein ACWERY_16105 [Streptomyces sp. NPDC004082]